MATEPIFYKQLLIKSSNNCALGVQYGGTINIVVLLLDNVNTCAVCYSNSHVQFFCLQVIEHHARHIHSCSCDDDILALREVLMTWLHPQQQVSTSRIHIHVYT